MVYYKLCGISVPPPCCWITYHTVMNLPIIPVAAVVQLQHLCPFSDLLWVAQLLKSYHVLHMSCDGFSAEQLASLRFLKIMLIIKEG